VIGGLAGNLVATILTVRLRPHRIAWPRPGELGRALSFSRDVVIGRISWYAYSNADILIVGKVLGTAFVGLYTVAWSLASVPVDKISSLVVRVTPALFSAVQSDLTAVRRYLTVLTQGVALVTFPITVGLALLADQFTVVVLGERWLDAVAALRLLAVYAAFRSISPLLAPVLNAIGEERFLMWNNVLAALVLPIGFLVGSQWSTAGVAAAWIILHPPITVLAFRRVQRRIHLTLRDAVTSLWPATSATLITCFAMLLVRLALPEAAGAALSLAVEASVGAVFYVLALFILHGDRVRAFREVLRLLRPGGPAQDGELAHAKRG
jgi:PST family polysaccharide transporter